MLMSFGDNQWPNYWGIRGRVSSNFQNQWDGPEFHLLTRQDICSCNITICLLDEQFENAKKLKMTIQELYQVSGMYLFE